MATVFSADVQSDPCLSSKVARFSKVSRMSEVLTQTLPAEYAAVSLTAAATVNLCSLLIFLSQPFLSSHRECAWTGAADVSQPRVKYSHGAVGLPLKV